MKKLGSWVQPVDGRIYSWVHVSLSEYFSLAYSFLFAHNAGMASDITFLDDFKRSQSGAKAQAFGKLFEQMFETMCKKNAIAVTRVPDGCKQVAPNKLIRVTTPFDWIINNFF